MTLTLCLLPKPSNSAPYSDSASSVQCISTASFHFAAVFATPNSNSFPLDRILSAEFIEVLAVLTDLHLLDLFPQTGTITGTILPNDTSLLGSLGHIGELRKHPET